jgi:histidinol-phosphate aminotransferase
VSEIERLLRSHVADVPPYVTARSQYRGGLLLDANENALGPSAPVVPWDLNRYPDPTNGELREALAAWLGVGEEHLWFGNGSDEVIDLLVRVLVEPRSPVVVAQPSYGVYSQRATAHGAVVRDVRLDVDFDLDVGGTLAASEGAALLFLCSPNNPTGNLLSTRRILELLAQTKCVVAVDEAYVEFAGGDSRAGSLAMLAGNSGAVPGSERLVVLRTFSKAWGLAGARVGYLVGSPTLVDAMNRVGLPYPLSSLSARAACAALGHASGMEQIRDLLVSERARVEQTLSDMGLRSLPSDSNFLLFFVNDAGYVQERLAREHSIVIRDRSRMPGLEGGLRVTVGAPSDNDLFLSALREVLS